MEGGREGGREGGKEGGREGGRERGWALTKAAFASVSVVYDLFQGVLAGGCGLESRHLHLRRIGVIIVIVIKNIYKFIYKGCINKDNIVYLKLIYKEYTSEEAECIIYSGMSERWSGKMGKLIR